MTIIIFLVDTSGSMNQRTYLGNTLLDLAKSSIEHFMKIRSRNPDSRWDRYMLLTFEDPPANVKAGWKESHLVFGNELKNLSAHGLTALGPALRNTFDLLNVNRMVSGIDTYGQGRNPFFLEPAVIVCITDGQRLTSTGGVVNELILPLTQPLATGAGYTNEPFRWDQRLFGLVMRLPATPPVENSNTFIPTAEDTSIHAMCDVTGGRSYAVTSQRMTMQALESIAQKCQCGVVINFEKLGNDPPESEETLDENGKSGAESPALTDWQQQRRMIYVQRGSKGFTGHWPIPEQFWPDLNATSIPARSAHPTVKFTCSSSDPLALENFPFDKYELEPSPLTQYILERRQPGVAWQCFVPNSAKYSETGHAFGYIKANTSLSSVNMVVMPYNYPVLLPLLDELCKVHKMKPTKKWRENFESYLKTMPPYYAQPLRRALQRIGAQNLVPDHLDAGLSYSVIATLKKLKNQAKLEYDRLVSSVGQKTIAAQTIEIRPLRPRRSLLESPHFHALMGATDDLKLVADQLREWEAQFQLAVPDPSIPSRPFTNVFDISRKNLIDHISRMRTNFMHINSNVRLQDEDSQHNIPVGQMGNYQEYLKRAPTPLREIETAPARLHTFGNPFKVNKNLMIDEADEAMPGQSPKRKASPYPVPENMPLSPIAKRRKKGALPVNFPNKPPFFPPDEDMDSSVSSDKSDDSSVVTDSSDDEVTEVMTNNHDGGAPQHHIHAPKPIRPAAVSPADGTSPANDVTAHIANLKKNRQVAEHNDALRRLCCRLVKRPGKDFEELMKTLATVQGSLEQQSEVIYAVVMEAKRFKRFELVRIIEAFHTAKKSSQTNGVTNNFKHKQLNCDPVASDINMFKR